MALWVSQVRSLSAPPFKTFLVARSMHSPGTITLFVSAVLFLSGRQRFQRFTPQQEQFSHDQ
jgi:hypothetical protein